MKVDFFFSILPFKSGALYDGDLSKTFSSFQISGPVDGDRKEDRKAMHTFKNLECQGAG